jgi:hypothetical protein
MWQIRMNPTEGRPWKPTLFLALPVIVTLMTTLRMQLTGISLATPLALLSVTGAVPDRKPFLESFLQNARVIDLVRVGQIIEPLGDSQGLLDCSVGHLVPDRRHPHFDQCGERGTLHRDPIRPGGLRYWLPILFHPVQVEFEGGSVTPLDLQIGELDAGLP